MNTGRHIRFFRNGRNQAIRIPREFEVDAEEAIIRRENDRLVIEPIRRKGLLATLSTLHTLEGDFPDIDQGMLPLDDVEL